MLYVYNTGYGRSDHIVATQTAGARADPDFSGIRVRVWVCPYRLQIAQPVICHLQCVYDIGI